MVPAYRNAILGLLVLASSSYGQDAATTKGKAIGETVNAAITAALPGVSAIDNLIATLFNGKNKQTLTPSDVKKAAATQAAKDETSKSTDANSQLASLKGAIAEIASANALAELAQTAETSLAQARGFLTIPNGWEAFKTQWAIAKTNIASIQKFDSAKLGEISNENVQDAFDNLRSQYEQWKGEIDNFSSRSDLALTLSSFDKLQTAVHKISTTPSVELRLIATQLGTIKAQPPAKSGLGIAPPPPPPPPSKSGDLSNFIKESVHAQ